MFIYETSVPFTIEWLCVLGEDEIIIVGMGIKYTYIYIIYNIFQIIWGRRKVYLAQVVYNKYDFYTIIITLD